MEKLLAAVVEDNVADLANLWDSVLVNASNYKIEADSKGEVYVEPTNMTFLHIAAFYDSLECFHHLLKNSHLLIDTPNAQGYLPIHLAAYGNATAVLSYILSIQPGLAKVELEDNCVQLLFLSVLGHSPECLELLLRYGADPNSPANKRVPPLNRAIQNKDIACVRKLLQAKAKADPVNKKDTTLMFAIRSFDFDAIPLLLESGEDPSEVVVNTFGQTECALQLACNQQQLGAVRAICSKLWYKIEPNATLRTRPVHWLAASGSPEIAKTLLQFDIDVNAVDASGRSAVGCMLDRKFNTSIKKQLKILDLLYAHGFEINPTDIGIKKEEYSAPRKTSPFGEVMTAIEKEPEFVRWFLVHAADINALANPNNRIVDLAMKPGMKIEVKKLFFEYYPELQNDYTPFKPS